MDELNEKKSLSMEELEQVAGGAQSTPYLHCVKCGYTFPFSDEDKYCDYDRIHRNRLHKGCGGILEIIMK